MLFYKIEEEWEQKEKKAKSKKGTGKLHIFPQD